MLRRRLTYLTVDDKLKIDQERVSGMYSEGWE